MSVVWQPGMRCVCIDAGYNIYEVPMKRPVKGAVYTIRVVGSCMLTGAASLMLAELDNGHCVGKIFQFEGQAWRLDAEPAYLASQFRPLSERRLDQFRALLAPQPTEQVGA